MRSSMFVTCLLAVGTTLGCSGSGDVPPTVPVSVNITLDGQPLANASVTFFPTSSDGRTAIVIGNTDSTGTAKMKYRGTVDGAAPGPYQVVVSKWIDKSGADLILTEEDDLGMKIAEGAKELLPPVYSSPEKTTLTATVGPNGGTFDLPLKSKP